MCFSRHTELQLFTQVQLSFFTIYTDYPVYVPITYQTQNQNHECLKHKPSSDVNDQCCGVMSLLCVSSMEGALKRHAHSNVKKTSNYFALQYQFFSVPTGRKRKNGIQLKEMDGKITQGFRP